MGYPRHGGEQRSLWSVLRNNSQSVQPINPICLWTERKSLYGNARDFTLHMGGYPRVSHYNFTDRISMCTTNMCLQMWVNIIMSCLLVYHNMHDRLLSHPAPASLGCFSGRLGVSVPHVVLVSPCFTKSNRQPPKHTHRHVCLISFIWCQGLKNLFCFSTVSYMPLHCTSIFHFMSQQSWKKSEARWEIAFQDPIFYYFKLKKLLHVTHQPKCPNQFPKCNFKKAVKLLSIHNKLSWEQVKILQHQFLTIRQFAVPLGYVSCTAL